MFVVHVSYPVCVLKMARIFSIYVTILSVTRADCLYLEHARKFPPPPPKQNKNKKTKIETARVRERVVKY